MRKHLFLLAIIPASIPLTAHGQFQSGASAADKYPVTSEGPLAEILDRLAPRQIGPTNMGGRIMDIAVVESNPSTYYVASASGGLWKTVNAGISYTPVFDYGNTVSMGAIGICQAKPNVLYVGTGEQSSRNSVAWGDGVYKSEDAGKTWKNIGLKETMHISKVIVHPTNPNIVYVGAIGRLWGRSVERGVYKTVDGGKTWSLVFTQGDRAGIIDLDMDPKNPNVLYASAWDRLRKPYVFASGGLESGLFKSTDGGQSWKKLEKGLPTSTLGRIGVSVYRKDPRILVATVEYVNPLAPPNVGREQEEEQDNDGMDLSNQSNVFAISDSFAQTGSTTPQGGAQAPKQAPKKETPKPKLDPRLSSVQGSQFNGGGLFMSRDGGESWNLVRQINPRPFYFSTPLIDPNNPKKIYVCGMALHVTPDLGKSWSTVREDALHADHHALWINPKDSNHILDGNDGGVYQSRDMGKTWEHHNKMPIAQFYAVSFDGQYPYWVYGGLQDNGSWGMPTQHPRGAIGPWDAQSLNGGDGFYSEADTVESEYIYSESQGGAVARLNRKTGQRRSIRPSLRGETLRFNWSTPIHISPHDNKVIFVGSNRLMMSKDRGDSWTAISPDLTTMSPRKIATLKIAARTSVNSEATGAENHCTIVTISESPILKGLIATGSDDGLVNVTQDGGATWNDVTANIPNLPSGLWCSRVMLSKWKASRLYALFDGHRSNDFRSYGYVSEDLGKTWKSIAGSLPDGDCLYVVREGEQNPNLLFLGSEMALRFSVDSGKTWSRIRGSFPTVAVHDVRVHPIMKDLVVATHGRAIWTIDIAALEGMSSGVPTKATVLGTSPAIRMPFVSGDPMEADSFFSARNTQPFGRIYYYLPEEPKEDVTVTLRTPDGREYILEGSTKRKGVNTVRWTPRIDGQIAPAGIYEVRVKVDGVETKSTLQVLDQKSY